MNSSINSDDLNNFSSFFKKHIHYIHLDKNEFFEDIGTQHKSSYTLLEQFKMDFPHLKINLNGNEVHSYSDILEHILRNYEYYLERILLICNKSILAKLMNITKKLISSDLHIVSDNSQDINIHLTLHHLAKQIYINSSFKIIEINNESNVSLEKNIDIKIIIDISNSEPILTILKIL